MRGLASALASACFAAASVSAVLADDPLHTAIPSTEVARHLDSSVVVCGHVLAVRQTPGNPPGELAFDLGAAGGLADLTVVIDRSDRAQFSVVFDRYIDRRQVCVQGKPHAGAGGLPVLSVNDPTGFRFMGALPGPPADFARGVIDADDLSDAMGGVKPTMAHMVSPRYTGEAMRAGIQGDVVFAAVVGVDGRISNLWPTSSVDPFLGLDDEAVAAARNWTFTPATVHGQAVPTRVTLQLQYRLHPSPVPSGGRYPVPLQIATPKLVPISESSAPMDPFVGDAGRAGQPGVISARATGIVPPRYPLDALQQNVQGTVLVDVIVAPDGTIARARVGHSFVGSLPSLDAEAEQCVRRWTFKPGKVDGQPAAVWVRASVEFQIRR